MKIGVLSSDSFTFLSALNNHIAFKLCESEHNVTDELTRRRVIYNTHVKNVYNNSLTVEAFDELNAVNNTAGDSVELSDNKFVAGLNDFEELVELRARVLRAAENIGEDFDSPSFF